ncbi:MAG: hypothetical protein WA154_06345 [Moraxellaceae bacterium]
MSKKYKPTFYRTPFEHVHYTLVRNQKQLDGVLDKSGHALVFLDLQASAQVDSIQQDGCCYCIVQIGDTSAHSATAVYGLLVHEAVHIWQAALKNMNESEPSKEFEAYSVQRIAMDLFYMYDRSQT